MIAASAKPREVYVPQSYDWGVEAQIDWYQAWAILAGERIKLQVFELRSMASGAAYHRAYTYATQQAFLEAHEFAFCYFNGVFRLWQGLISRHGRSQGTRQMIELLSLGVAHGWERLRAAVEQALSLGCHDVAAIRHLLVAGLLTRPAVEAVELGALSGYERPQRVIASYDQLLTEAGVPGVHVFLPVGSATS